MSTNKNIENRIKKIVNFLKSNFKEKLELEENITALNNHEALIHPINHVNISNESDLWFCESETESSYIFLFGLLNRLPEDDSLEYNLIIDFDKQTSFNPDKLGLLYEKNSKIRIYLNKDLFLNKYPDINTDTLKSKYVAVLKKLITTRIEIIDLGEFNKDFIKNIEVLINSNTTPEYKTIDETYLHPLTKQSMNIFINALNADKTEENALKIANIDKDTVKQWYMKGINGQSDYLPFSREYNKFKPDIEKNTKIQFIKLLNKGKTIDEALKITKLQKNIMDKWCKQGKNGNKKYIEFYNAYTKAKNIEEMDKIIKLINEGKTKSEISSQLNVNIQEIYEREKKSDGYEKFINVYETTQQETYKCSICGRKISKDNEEGICKRCLKKQYSVKIIKRLLSQIDINDTFRKDDLKRLDLKEMQIQDCIWTLQEHNLIIEENNKFKFNTKEYIDEFVKEAGLEPINIKSSNKVLLNKTCKTCGKTLEISKFFKSTDTDDGYEDNCKNCKKLITTAKYLSEILKYVDYDQEFSEKDLTKYFNTFKLQAQIWSLLDHDLVKINPTTNNYILTNERKGTDFLNKYLPGKTTNKKQIQTQIISTSPARQNEKPINFDLNKSETFLNTLNTTKNIHNALMKANIQLKTLKNWIKYGEKRIKPLDDFYDNYFTIISDYASNISINNVKDKNNELKSKMITLIAYLNMGLTEKESLNLADVEFNTYNYWLTRGIADCGELYTKFYENIDNMNINIDIFKNNNILNTLTESYKLDDNTGIAWVNKVKKQWIYSKRINGQVIKIFADNPYELYEKVIRGSHVWGITDYQKAKVSLNISKNNWEDILKPLDEKYEKTFTNRSNRTGIAWVNRNGKQWIYSKSENGKQIKIISHDIYQLYQKVTDEGLVWGIRDYEKASKIIDIPRKYTYEDSKDKNPTISANSENTSSDIVKRISVNTFVNSENTHTAIVKGIINNNELLDTLNDIKEFENEIVRIMTTSRNNEIDLFIELDIASNKITLFEDKVYSLNWNID